jgi:hypothetical protein
MRQTTNQHFPINKINISLNKCFSEQHTLQAGTAQVICGDWTGRIVSYLQDSRQMGRWCGIKMRLKHDQHLHIILAYRVCDQNLGQVGVETAFSQQHFLLSLANVTTPNPRNQFMDDLIISVKKWQATGDEILIMLDANK